MKHSIYSGLLLVALLVVGCDKNSSDYKLMYNLDKQFFASCDDMSSELKERNRLEKLLNHSYFSESFNNSVNANLPQTSSSPKTNVQVSGVDEADHIKVKDNLIISVYDRVLRINELATAKTLSETKIPIENRDFPESFDDMYLSIHIELYTYGDKVIVLSASSYDASDLFVYNISNPAKPKLEERRSYNGSLSTSRLIDEKLLLVINEYRYGHEEPVTTDKSLSLSCKRVLKPMVNDTDRSVIKIFSINLDGDKDKDASLGLLGSGGVSYVTKSHMYLSKSPNTMGFLDSNDEVKSIVLKINLDKLDIQSTAVGLIEGYAKDQWALNESRSDILHIATTANVDDNDVGRINYFWSLKEVGDKLILASQPLKYAPREDIRAVRFMKDYAYVVTFEQIDPLFAIDIKDPESPKIVSELKIPGFSTYLHPLTETKLLGVGVDGAWSSRVQVSLFDINNPLDVTRTFEKVHGKYASHSELVYNHHAFSIDESTQRFAMPISIDPQHSMYDDAAQGNVESF